MMDLSFKGLHTLSNIKILLSSEYIDCSHNLLTCIKEALGDHKRLRILRCESNKLSAVPFIPKLERLYCEENSIRYLPVYQTLIEIKCSHNHIEELPPFPKTLKVLECKFNRIRSIKNLPDGLRHIDCSFNPIESIDCFPKLLVNIICKHNLLQCIPYVHRRTEYLAIAHNPIHHLPDGMEKVDYLDFRECPIILEKMPAISNIICDSDFIHNVRYHNPAINRLVVVLKSVIRLPIIPPSINFMRFHCMYENDYYCPDIIYNVTDDIDDMVMKTHVHHRFIHLYYCVRFKKQFMYWLWHLVRRPKIERECHPHVIEQLIETIGMEAFLETD